MTIEDTIRHVVPCINPGLSCCPYRMTCSTKLVTNVLAGGWQCGAYQSRCSELNTERECPVKPLPLPKRREG